MPEPITHAVYVLTKDRDGRWGETATVCGAEGLEVRDADEHVTCIECRRIAQERGVDLA